MNIKQLIKECYNDAVKRGEYDCPKCNGKGYIKVGKEIFVYESDCHICKKTGINPNKNINELIALINLELYRSLDCYINKRFVQVGDCIICFNRIRDNLDFKSYYTEYLINVYEPYLASTFIKIFELCGYIEKHLNIDLITEKFSTHLRFIKGQPSYDIFKFVLYFPTRISDWIDDLLELKEGHENWISERIADILADLYYFVEHSEIDIETHIKLKLQYNKEQ